jgi:hypothetical protein
MDFEDTNYIKHVHIIEVDGEPIDAVELSDGRVLAIDGAQVTLFEDLESLLESGDEDDDIERPAMPL